MSIQFHDKTCMKKEVACPKNGCSMKMERHYISYHVASQCEHAVITCKYMNIGCEKKLRRRDMAAHEQDDTVHLHMALDTINTLQIQCKYEKQIKFKLTEFKVKKEKSEGVQSPSYYSSPNGYNMALQVFVNGNGGGEGTQVTVFAHFLKGKYDNQLKWPFVGMIIFTLLNQLEDKNHHTMTMTLAAEDNVNVGELPRGRNLIPHSALGYNPAKNTQYLKDDTLHFRMSVEPANQDKPWLQ